MAHDTLNNIGISSDAQIWGTNENNIWIYSNAGMVHFNGNSWKHLSQPWGNLDALYGTDKNNIWCFAGGNYNGANAWYFDGVNWQDKGLYAFTEQDGFLAITEICGENSNNLYASGLFMYGNEQRKAAIMHFDGTDWKFIDVDGLEIMFDQIKYDRVSKKIFVGGRHQIWDTTSTIPNNIGTINKIFELKNNELIEIYSEQSTGRYLTEINGQVYFIQNDVLFTYSENKFSIFKDFSESNYILYQPKGRSFYDMLFIAIKKTNTFGELNYLLHYNGTNLDPLLETRNIVSYEIIGNSIFVLSEYVNGTKIASIGKLQE